VRECVGLIRRGFPPDFVFSLSNDVRCGFLIIAGEQEGGEYDWSRGEWRERK
jgi:hypothetical protein